MENKPYCSPSLDNQLSHHFTPNSNPNAFAMQTSALRTLLRNDSSESLEYYNAKLPKIKINPVEPVQPINLRPLKLDNDEILIEYLPTSPSLSPTLVDQNTALPTREEHHQAVHTAHEVEAQHDAMQTSSDFGSTTRQPTAIPASFTPVTIMAARDQALPEGSAPSRGRARSIHFYPTRFQHYVSRSRAFAGMDDVTDDSISSRSSG